VFSRIYLHIPWCISKCNYCSFNSFPLETGRLQQTCELMIKEMELAATLFSGNQPLESLYLGGGTPSLITPEQLDMLIISSKRLFGHQDRIEITLEANPGTVTAEKLIGYHQAGVNRLSIGAQSFNNQMLRLLGRIHTAEEIHTAFRFAEASGFKSIGLDLICGLPGQTGLLWRSDLNEALLLRPDHISIYGLTIEEGTPFAVSYPVGSKDIPDDDLSADMLEQANLLLTEAGYEHYEISNFALKDSRSMHNCGYWQRDGYLGIGPGAHSFFKHGNGIRFCNFSSFEKWAADIVDNRLATAESQALTREEALSEFLFLGLRMSDGINPDRFADIFGERPELLFEKELRQLQQAGLLIVEKNRICLSRRGMLLSNQVFARFV